MRNLYNVCFVTKQNKEIPLNIGGVTECLSGTRSELPCGIWVSRGRCSALRWHRENSQVSSRVVLSCPYKAWLWHPREELPVLKCGGFVSAELMYHLQGPISTARHLFVALPWGMHGQSNYENSENSVLVKFGQLFYVYGEHLRTCSKQGVRQTHWF